MCTIAKCNLTNDVYKFPNPKKEEKNLLSERVINKGKLAYGVN